MEKVAGHITIASILRHQNNWGRYLAWKKGAVREAERYHVSRMLACRTPRLGLHIYHCPPCDIQRIVPHSCKSPFCSSCGKVRTDLWCEQLLSDLLNVPYRHVTTTLPWQVRLPIKDNRVVLLNAICRAAADTIFSLTLGRPCPLSRAGRKRMQAMSRAKRYLPGIIIVIHTFGSDLKWNVHLHIIITCGGLSKDGTRFVHAPEDSLVSGPELATEWKLRVIRAFDEADREGTLVKRRLRGDRRRRVQFGPLLGFIRRMKWHVLIGRSLAEPEPTVRYCCRYTKRPVIGEYRIRSYDGQYVTFQYKDYYNEGKPAFKKFPVLLFIDRLVQHIPEKHYRYVRYYGLFSNRMKAHHLPKARQLLRQHRRKPPSPETWEQRRKKAGERTPLRCPRCRGPMFLVAILFGAPQFIAALLNIDIDLPIPTPCFTRGYGRLIRIDIRHVIPSPNTLLPRHRNRPSWVARK